MNMGLKIKDTIATDQGMTDQAYLYIESYELEKNSGVLIFSTQLYISFETRLNNDRRARNYLVPNNFQYRFPKREDDSSKYDFSILIEKDVFELGYEVIRKRLLENFSDVENIFDSGQTTSPRQL